MKMKLWCIFGIILLFVCVVSPPPEAPAAAEVEGAPKVSTIIYLNGDSYVGSLDDNGMRNGKGILKLAEGDFYDGDWLDDKRHGQGILKWIDGDSYVGEYKYDQKHGKGLFTSTDHEYDGEFKNGLMDGNGTYTWADGSVYNGEFQNNRMHGNGKYISANGSVYDGMWFNDKRDGLGTQTRMWNLYRYQGGWSNNKKHGKGVISLFGDLVECEGEWKDGRLINMSNHFAVLERAIEVIWHYLFIHYFGFIHVLVVWMCLWAFCLRWELVGASLTESNEDPDSDARGDGVDVTFTLDQDHIQCGICYNAFTTDTKSTDQTTRELLPVLGSCGHYFCHGCIIRCRFMVGSNGAIGCPKCMKADQFVPENPIHHRMLIDLLRRARPTGKSSSDEKVHQGKCVSTCACENEYQLVTEAARLFGLLLFGCIFMWYKE